MVNKIWAFFIIVGIITCIINGDIELLNKEILNSSTDALDMIIKIFPVIALWLGIMNIAKESKLLDKLSHLMQPL